MNTPRYQPDAWPSLAVFGKHPGWDDHIEDLGIDSARLIQVRQFFYVEGIGGNIESGAWDKLEQEGKRIPFRHVVVWSSPEGLVVGRLWDSRDGKGRVRYPMLAFIECAGLSLERALAEMLPRLEGLEQRCAALTAAGDVRALVERVRGELKEVCMDEGNAPPAGQPGAELVRLAECPALGPQALGLHRILHKIYREWSAHAPGAGTASAESKRPGHLRVPRCAEGVGRAAALWCRFISGQLAPSVPLFLLLPVCEPWLDILVGLPGPPQFYALQASPEALPLTSDIPYTLDDGFARRVDDLMGRARGAAPGGISIFGPAPAGGEPLQTLREAWRRGRSWLNGITGKGAL